MKNIERLDLLKENIIELQKNLDGPEYKVSEFCLLLVDDVKVRQIEIDKLDIDMENYEEAFDYLCNGLNNRLSKLELNLGLIGL